MRLSHSAVVRRPSDDSHPAIARFLKIWDEPIDVSNGSRQGMDDHEQAVVYAAQRFVADEPPPQVRKALVRWLRSQMSLGGAWNYTGQALRVICETDEHPLVAELSHLLIDGATRAQVLALVQRCANEPIEVRDAMMSAGWGMSPGGLCVDEWKALFIEE